MENMQDVPLTESEEEAENFMSKYLDMSFDDENKPISLSFQDEFMLKSDAFSCEICRAIYGHKNGQPANNSMAYFKAAENYALFGISEDITNISDFSLFPNFVEKNHDEKVSDENSLCKNDFPKVNHAPITPLTLKLQTCNVPKKLQLKAVNNFFQQVQLANTAFSFFNRRTTNNEQQQTKSPLMLLFKPDEQDTKNALPFIGRNILQENWITAQKAAAVANYLQQKPSRLRSLNLTRHQT